jgi:hypothetical protein
MPFAPATSPHLSRPVRAARAHFHAMGWSVRAAAPALGVCYQHLSQVLTGRRQSHSLLARILALPPR